MRIARANPAAQFAVPGDYPMDADDVLAMFERGLMARCNRGLPEAPDTADLLLDGRVINNYARGMRMSGCRGVLRTKRMQRRYPHINNQLMEY